MSDLVTTTPDGLLNVETGELLPATVDNAAVVIQACRNVKRHADELIDEATAWLVSEAERRGTKTLHTEDNTITLTGGLSDEYDAQDLMELLRDAGCPEDRVEAAVTTEISYKVNRSVLKQLAMNKDYQAAIERAAHKVEKKYRAIPKLRRQS